MKKNTKQYCNLIIFNLIQFCTLLLIFMHKNMVQLKRFEAKGPLYPRSYKNDLKLKDPFEHNLGLIAKSPFFS